VRNKANRSFRINKSSRNKANFRTVASGKWLVKSKSQEREPRIQTEEDFAENKKTRNKANRFFRINKTVWNKANSRTVTSG
jgi:hypothetical protein